MDGLEKNKMLLGGFFIMQVMGTMTAVEILDKLIPVIPTESLTLFMLISYFE